MHVTRAVQVPCPRCYQPITLAPSITSVPGYFADRDKRRRGRFLVTVPVVTHRCPDLDQADDDGGQ